MTPEALILRGGSWVELGEAASAIRFEVFVHEQGVPADMELDELDATSFHILASTGTRAIATGRLLSDGHIGRVAVLANWRKKGVGAAVMQALMQEAAKRGMGELHLNAQLSAVDFYKRLGFHLEGEVFMEAGIAHQTMGFAPGVDRR